jgi:hypothetical protein
MFSSAMRQRMVRTTDVSDGDIGCDLALVKSIEQSSASGTCASRSGEAKNIEQKKGLQNYRFSAMAACVSLDS